MCSFVAYYSNETTNLVLGLNNIMTTIDEKLVQLQVLQYGTTTQSFDEFVYIILIILTICTYYYSAKL